MSDETHVETTEAPAEDYSAQLEEMQAKLEEAQGQVGQYQSWFQNYMPDQSTFDSFQEYHQAKNQAPEPAPEPQDSDDYDIFDDVKTIREKTRQIEVLENRLKQLETKSATTEEQYYIDKVKKEVADLTPQYPFLADDTAMDMLFALYSANDGRKSMKKCAKELAKFVGSGRGASAPRPIRGQAPGASAMPLREPSDLFKGSDPFAAAKAFTEKQFGVKG